MTSSNADVFIGLRESMQEHKSSFSILSSQGFLSQNCIENLYDYKMEIKDEIGEWVRAARKHAKLSGAELGAKLALELRTTRGNTKGNISHWELKKHLPSISQLVAVSKITAFPLPASILENHTDAGAAQKLGGDAAVTAPGYEYLLGQIVAALSEREVPPHIQTTIITLLDTCPLRAK